MSNREIEQNEALSYIERQQDRIEALEAALMTEWAARDNRIEALEAEVARLNSIIEKMLNAETDRIEALEAALKLSDEALDQMLIWMPSGFAPQSQANAMRLAYEARKVARAALAEGQDKVTVR